MSDRGVVVLGVTSAVARGIAREYALRGYRLIVTSRESEEANAIADDLRVRYQVEATGLTWDAADFDSHQTFFDECVRVLGDSLEGVILCSGYMEEQEIAQRDLNVARRTIDINLTGSICILNLFANHFESKRTGFIAGLSSVAGERGRMSNYIYGASKAGFSAYLDGLRNRLHHAGVHVITIKPGIIDTKMTWGKSGLPLMAQPEPVAKAMVQAIEKRKNTAYVPWIWRYVMLIIRNVPEWKFKSMRM